MIVSKTKCTSKKHLGKFLADNRFLFFQESFLQQVVAKGGEGVMLRAPESFYTPGRSQTSLKRVKVKQDTEVKVISKSKEIIGLVCEQ